MRGEDHLGRQLIQPGAEHGAHDCALSYGLVEYLRTLEMLYPDLFQPYGGFPDGVKVDNSYVVLPGLPGIGFEGKADLFAEMKQLAS